ncbi:MAG: hypothetical protein UU21_C0016G0008 [Candidatus Levybacteria bacterium GW2011_GWA2_40_8]|nr:MAG: hypothetical protein UU21_C0016G0008 [Candidatus Levybacteria bacterium GW2011_GWA2_40_8]
MAVSPEEIENGPGIPSPISRVESPSGPLDAVSYDVAERYVMGIRNANRSSTLHGGRRNFWYSDQRARMDLAEAVYDVSPLFKRNQGSSYRKEEEEQVAQRLELIVEAMMRTRLMPTSGDINFGRHSETKAERHLRWMRDVLVEKRLARSKASGNVTQLFPKPAQIEGASMKLS